jgi:isoleucyl-tRNA synthetase
MLRSKVLTTNVDGETGATWILLEKCLSSIYKDPKKAKFTVLEKMKGSALKGLAYEPLFDYFADVHPHNLSAREPRSWL